MAVSGYVQMCYVSLQHQLSSLSLSLFPRKAVEDTECGSTDPPQVEERGQQLPFQVSGSRAALRPRLCDRRERPSTWPHLPTWLSQPGQNVAGLKLCPPQVSEASGPWIIA